MASFVDFWIQRLRLKPTLIVSVLGLALLSFLFVRGIWRDLHAPPDQPIPQTTDDNAGPTPISSHPVVAAQEPESGPEPRESQESIHRELTRLVRDDPETAAEMLGEWVRKAG